MGKRLWSSRRR